MLIGLFFQEITRAAIFFLFYYLYIWLLLQSNYRGLFILCGFAWVSNQASKQILQRTFKTKVGLNINATSVISS